MKRTSNLLWGVVLIIVGVIFGLNAIGITDINIFFDGWLCLFIIVPCFIDLFKDEDKIEASNESVYGKGDNYIDIDGGVGEIVVNFVD